MSTLSAHEVMYTDPALLEDVQQMSDDISVLQEQMEAGVNGDPIPGPPGRSAYQTAVDNGFVGSETQWIASLRGADGQRGPKGETGPQPVIYQEEINTAAAVYFAQYPVQNGQDGADGTDGTNGHDGASAYEVARQNGFQGSESAWLASLHGERGIAGPPPSDQTVAEKVAAYLLLNPPQKGDAGTNGKSAYELAVQLGYGGTLNQWLETLKGAPGTPGTNGTNGSNGTNGTNGVPASVAVGSVSTLAPGAQATVTNAGNTTAALFNFGIPAGVAGQPGTSGTNGKTAYELAVASGYTGTQAQWLAGLKASVQEEVAMAPIPALLLGATSQPITATFKNFDQTTATFKDSTGADAIDYKVKIRAVAGITLLSSLKIVETARTASTITFTVQAVGLASVAGVAFIDAYRAG
jgi:hypothetical protein